MIGNKVQAVTYIIGLPDDAKVEVKEWKPVRSKQQNAYYWALVNRIANRMNLSKTEVHNLMLRDYGQYMSIGGETPIVYIPDTEQAEAETRRSAVMHLKPTSYTKEGKGDVDFRAYRVMMGSRFYDTGEMAILLRGCVQEAKALGIETLTPEELQTMRAEDEKRERKKHDTE